MLGDARNFKIPEAGKQIWCMEKMTRVSYATDVRIQQFPRHIMAILATTAVQMAVLFTAMYRKGRNDCSNYFCLPISLGLDSDGSRCGNFLIMAMWLPRKRCIGVIPNSPA